MITRKRPRTYGRQGSLDAAVETSRASQRAVLPPEWREPGLFDENEPQDDGLHLPSPALASPSKRGRLKRMLAAHRACPPAELDTEARCDSNGSSTDAAAEAEPLSLEARMKLLSGSASVTAQTLLSSGSGLGVRLRGPITTSSGPGDDEGLESSDDEGGVRILLGSGRRERLADVREGILRGLGSPDAASFDAGLVELLESLRRDDFATQLRAHGLIGDVYGAVARRCNGGTGGVPVERAALGHVAVELLQDRRHVPLLLAADGNGGAALLSVLVAQVAADSTATSNVNPRRLFRRVDACERPALEAAVADAAGPPVRASGRALGALAQVLRELGRGRASVRDGDAIPARLRDGGAVWGAARAVERGASSSETLHAAGVVLEASLVDLAGHDDASVSAAAQALAAAAVAAALAGDAAALSSALGPLVQAARVQVAFEVDLEALCRSTACLVGSADALFHIFMLIAALSAARPLAVKLCADVLVERLAALYVELGSELQGLGEETTLADEQRQSVRVYLGYVLAVLCQLGSCGALAGISREALRECVVETVRVQRALSSLPSGESFGDSSSLRWAQWRQKMAQAALEQAEAVLLGVERGRGV